MGGESLKCLHAGQFQVAEGWSARTHTHPFVEVVVVLKGGLEVLLGSKRFEAHTGDIAFYAPQTAHRESALPRRQTEFVYFACAHTPEGTISPMLHDTHGRVRVLTRWLCEEQASSYGERRRHMNVLLEALMLELLKLSHSKPGGPVEAARAHLRQNLERTPTLKELAGLARLSKYHFGRLYKRVTGRTPMQDLRLTRVAAACDLLLTTSLPLKEIARRVGFCDEYYFSRVFRQVHGLPPGSFREER